MPMGIRHPRSSATDQPCKDNLTKSEYNNKRYDSRATEVFLISCTKNW